MTTRILALMLGLSACGPVRADAVIQTEDIGRFWTAFDSLANARSRADSVDVIQRLYIDQASENFNAFIEARNFTAEEYVSVIRRAPKFWTSIRPLTERIAGRAGEIEAILDTMAVILPGFRRPDVCFAIGCLRTGGTTNRQLILIGAEIAAADSTVNTTELNAWLQAIMGQTGDIVAMVAHEAVHTRQRGFPFDEIFSLLKHKKLSLLNQSIGEGTADFIPRRFLGLTINAPVHAYGAAHHAALWCAFSNAMDTSRFEYGDWLYGGSRTTGRPADLGYYIGCRISEAFYDQASNKTRALKTLLRRGQYKKVYRRSGFADITCPDPR
jgi:hypothetical protein